MIRVYPLNIEKASKTPFITNTTDVPNLEPTNRHGKTFNQPSITIMISLYTSISQQTFDLVRGSLKYLSPGESTQHTKIAPQNTIYKDGDIYIISPDAKVYLVAADFPWWMNHHYPNTL